MKWRLRSWKPESHFSTVEIEIEQNRDDTTLKMKQKRVPSSAVDTTKQGWKASFISFSVVYFFLGGCVNITSCSVETRQSGLPCSWQPLTLTKEQVIPSYPHKTHVNNLQAWPLNPCSNFLHSSGSLFTVTMLKGEFTIFLGLLLGSDQKVVRLRLLAIGTGENDPLVGRNPRVNVVGPIKS